MGEHCEIYYKTEVIQDTQVLAKAYAYEMNS